MSRREFTPEELTDRQRLQARINARMDKMRAAKTLKSKKKQ